MKFFKLQKMGHTKTEVRLPIQPDRFSYKIQRMADGQFSKGTSHPRFGRIGRTWNRMSDLTSHLRHVYQSHPNSDPYDGCAIVEFASFKTKVHQSVKNFLLEKNKK